ncbi:LysE family translocator [Halioxenophilus sp. WMMB6]|uniref:LysE family translocator n=1 Tax=Halioxenophilus sp. WMMB6 TaxID=3073815 RepID=UPI00295E3250|nr:LysE family translocator [Halioxenophilus sp. WMMB6]
MYFSFFLASLLLALSPGPDNLYVLAQSLQAGARVGVAITLGLCSGLLVHTALVALGVAQFIGQRPWALALLALFGCGYLAYLAWGSWRSGVVVIDLNGSADEASQRSLASFYGRGVVMNLSNPKVLLFFLAFLPQFVPAGVGAAGQIMVLGGLFITAALLVFITIAVMAARISRWLVGSRRWQLGVNRAVALVLTLLALRLGWLGVVQVTAV